jgi:hypothetical protein
VIYPSEQEGEVAFEIHQDVLKLKRQMGMAFIEMGRLLKKIRDEKHYQVLGHDSFKSYLADSELGFKRRTAYYYIEIYEYFVEKLGYEIKRLADIGYKNLIDVLAVVKKLPEPEPEALLNDAKELSTTDFKKKYKDEEKEREFNNYLAPPEYYRCKDCEKWHIVIPLGDCCEEWLNDVYERLKKRKEDGA